MEKSPERLRWWCSQRIYDVSMHVIAFFYYQELFIETNDNSSNKKNHHLETGHLGKLQGQIYYTHPCLELFIKVKW
jgi:hypothetical protein